MFLVAIKRVRRKPKHLPANQNWKKYLAVLFGNRLFTGPNGARPATGKAAEKPALQLVVNIDLVNQIVC